MKSVKKIALGGMIAAVSMVLMMITGLIPMAEFALPAIAGVLLVMVVVEISPKWAALVFAAVALLSLMMAPSKESAIFYTVFLGWYPIAKAKLEQIRHSVKEWILKLAILNVSVGIGLAASVFLFRLQAYREMLSDSFWVLFLGWLFVNAAFVIYDLALTRLITSYINWFRPKYLKKGMGKF